MKRSKVTAALLAAVAVLAVACGSTSAPAASSGPVHVKYIYFPAAHTASVFVAKEQGIFARNGLDVEMVLGSSGVQMSQALVAGDVQFTNDALPDVVDLAQHNKHVLYIYPMVSRLTMDTVVKKSVLAKAGVTPSSPLKDRFNALKGLKVGVTAPRSESDVFPRFYLAQAGLNPDKDATFVTIGSAANLIAAFKSGSIDAFTLTPPTPDIGATQGDGTVLIRASAGDVPELVKFFYQGTIVTADYAKSHPDVVARFVRSLVQASQIVTTDMDKTVASEKPWLKQDDATLQVAYKSLLPAYTRPDASLIDPQVLSQNLQLLKQVGSISAVPSLDEGGIWTNEFIRKAQG